MSKWIPKMVLLNEEGLIPFFWIDRFTFSRLKMLKLLKFVKRFNVARISWCGPQKLNLWSRIVSFTDNMVQTILEKIREAIEEDPILRDRIDVEKLISQLHNHPLLPLAVRRAEEAKQQHKKFGIEEQKEFYDYELKRELYRHALKEPMSAKMPAISKRLVKWREKTSDPYEFYGVLANYHKNITDNTIDYFIMSENSDFVKAAFDYHTRNTFRELFHYIDIKPPRAKGEPRPPSRELYIFVKGISGVRGPPFRHIGEASNNRDALEKAKYLGNLLKMPPFNKFDVGEILLRYGELIKKPKNLVPGIEEYVEPAEFIFKNYFDIKQRTNSPSVSFYDRRIMPVIHAFIELERRHSRKHINPRQKTYTA